jgi:hypothetical protein
MTIEIAHPQYQMLKKRAFSGQEPSSSGPGIVCLFSLLGLIFTAIASMLLGPEMISTLMLAGG